MAKNKINSIAGLVVVRGKSADSETKGVALSIGGQDAQDIRMEVLVDENIDELSVDELLTAEIVKGETEGVTFEVVSESNTGHSNRLVVKGEMQGQIVLNLLPGQQDFFAEGETYTVVFVEAEVEA